MLKTRTTANEGGLWIKYFGQDLSVVKAENKGWHLQRVKKRVDVIEAKGAKKGISSKEKVWIG
jgi:hypothetical protein